MSTPKGYNSYRGRGSVVKVIAAVLLVLVILAAVGFMLIQRYLVYDKSGTPHLELPSNASASASAAASAAASGGDLNLAIDKPAGPTALYALELDAMPLTDWPSEQARLTATDSSLNAAVLTVKDSAGHVYFDSAAAKVVSDGIVRADSSTTAALAAMTASDTYAVARLSCLRDPIAAKADLDGMGLKNTGGYVFYDGNNENWLDPSKQGTRTYLAELARACAALGFDEILLADLSYPTAGKLDKIAYTGSQLLSENLSLLLRDIRDALADYPNVRLSVELPAAVLSGGAEEKAGLALTDMAALADRVYAPADASEAVTFSAAVQSANADADFVPEVSSAAGLSGSYLLLGS